MKTNTTTQTTQQILNSYRQAVKALQEAQRQLKSISADDRNWSSHDAAWYAHQIAELISCDEGEAGLQSLIKLLEQRV